MCTECGNYICPSSCPNYTQTIAEKGRVFGHCSICGNTIHTMDNSFRKYELIICESCMSYDENHSPQLRNFFK